MDTQETLGLPQKRWHLWEQTQGTELSIFRSGLSHMVTGSAGRLGNDRMSGRRRSEDQYRRSWHLRMDQGAQREIPTLANLYLRQTNRG